ncbi:Mbeg1-like protein [Anaerocolumna jejuensis]|uniref:Mbeg1-like protein n=1 Tax=Anaerocolumna jejuensis TaxID=259063 RepID=UPI003F7C9302
MDTMINYLKWRGDLTLREHPFNSIDNVILSTLVYIDFVEIRSQIRCSNRMLLSDALTELLDRGYRAKCLMEMKPEFLYELLKSNRFKNIYLSDYRDIYDKERNCQFAAIKFTLEDDTAYIAFRGTDKTIVGWRENFMMSFKETDAQLEAVTYLNDVLAKEDISYRVGGHSKGGNLAVYSSANCKHLIQDKIIEIYDNDGPGFCKGIIQDHLLAGIKNRIHRFVPEYSVIGMLFELDVPFQIVKSCEKGINQHDPFSWQVEGDAFITCENLNPQAEYLNKILDKWIEEEDMEHREIFVEQVFNALEVTGATEIGEVTGGLNRMEKVVTEILYSNGKTKRVLHNLLTAVIESFKKINILEIMFKRESFLSVVMISFGMLLFILPGDGLQILGTGFIFTIFVFSVLRLGHHFKEKSKYKYKKLCVSLGYLLCILLLTLLAFHTDTLKLSLNFLLGSTVFIYGIINLKNILQRRIKSGSAVKLKWTQSITSMAVGLAVLGIPYNYIEKNLRVMGLGIIILGFTEILYNAYKLVNAAKE